MLRESASQNKNMPPWDFSSIKTHFPQAEILVKHLRLIETDELSEPSFFHYFSGSGSSVSFPSFPLRKSRRTTISARS